MKEKEIEIEVINGIEVITKKNILVYLEIKGFKCTPAWFYRNYKDNLIEIPANGAVIKYDYKHFQNLVKQKEQNKKNKVKKIKVKI